MKQVVQHHCLAFEFPCRAVTNTLPLSPRPILKSYKHTQMLRDFKRRKCVPCIHFLFYSLGALSVIPGPRMLCRQSPASHT